MTKAVKRLIDFYLANRGKMTLVKMAEHLNLSASYLSRVLCDARKAGLDVPFSLKSERNFIRHDKAGKPWRMVLKDGKHLFYHRLVWEQHNGPIPQGRQLRFKDGDSLNCYISNLQLHRSRRGFLMKERSLEIKARKAARDLAVMELLKEHTQEETAKIMGIHKSTVSTIVSRMRGVGVEMPKRRRAPDASAVKMRRQGVAKERREDAPIRSRKGRSVSQKAPVKVYQIRNATEGKVPVKVDSKTTVYCLPGMEEQTIKKWQQRHAI